RLERRVGRRVLDEVELEAVGAELAALHGLDMGMTAEHGLQLETIHPLLFPPSDVLRIVDIDEPGFRQGLAHAVHVEAEFARSEARPLAALVRVALLRLLGDLGGIAL